MRPCPQHSGKKRKCAAAGCEYQPKSGRCRAMPVKGRTAGRPSPCTPLSGKAKKCGAAGCEYQKKSGRCRRFSQTQKKQQTDSQKKQTPKKKPPKQTDSQKKKTAEVDVSSLQAVADYTRGMGKRFTLVKPAALLVKRLLESIVPDLPGLSKVDPQLAGDMKRHQWAKLLKVDHVDNKTTKHLEHFAMDLLELATNHSIDRAQDDDIRVVDVKWVLQNTDYLKKLFRQ